MKAQTPSISHRAGAAMLLCWIAVARPATGQVGPPPTANLDMAQEYTFAKRGQSMVVMFDGSVVRESYANGAARIGSSFWQAPPRALPG